MQALYSGHVPPSYYLSTKSISPVMTYIDRTQQKDGGVCDPFVESSTPSSRVMRPMLLSTPPSGRCNKIRENADMKVSVKRRKSPPTEIACKIAFSLYWQKAQIDHDPNIVRKYHKITYRRVHSDGLWSSAFFNCCMH